MPGTLDMVDRSARVAGRPLRRAVHPERPVAYLTSARCAERTSPLDASVREFVPGDFGGVPAGLPGVPGGSLGPPRQAGTALGVDRGEHQPTEHGQVLLEFRPLPCRGRRAEPSCGGPNLEPLRVMTTGVTTAAAPRGSDQSAGRQLATVSTWARTPGPTASTGSRSKSAAPDTPCCMPAASPAEALREPGRDLHHGHRKTYQSYGDDGDIVALTVVWSRSPRGKSAPSSRSPTTR